MIRSIIARWRRRGGRGEDVLVEDHVDLRHCTLIGRIRVGLRSYANETLIREAEIGRYCSIGRRCSIGAARHAVGAISTHPSSAPHDHDPAPTTRIGHDVWIGDNVVVVSGLSIGDGAVIGAGAVVTHDVAPYAIVGGVPAKLIRMRFDDPMIEALLAAQWWRHGDAALLVGGKHRSPAHMLDRMSSAPLPEIVPPHFHPR